MKVRVVDQQDRIASHLKRNGTILDVAPNIGEVLDPDLARGGYIQHRFIFRYEWSGFYEPDDKTYRVIVPPDEIIGQRQMLEACALRFYDPSARTSPSNVSDLSFSTRPTHSATCTSCGCASWSAGRSSTATSSASTPTTPPSPPPEWAERLQGQEDWVIGDMKAHG